MTRNEKIQKLERLGFLYTDTEDSYEEFANPFVSEVGYMGGDYALNALTGELIISETVRKQWYLDQQHLSNEDIIHHIFILFKSAFSNLWVQNHPERGHYGLLFFNDKDHVLYSWDWDPEEEPEETLVERLIAYGKANFTVDWGEDD